MIIICCCVILMAFVFIEFDCWWICGFLIVLFPYCFSFGPSLLTKIKLILKFFYINDPFIHLLTQINPTFRFLTSFLSILFGRGPLILSNLSLRVAWLQCRCMVSSHLDDFGNSYYENSLTPNHFYSHAWLCEEYTCCFNNPFWNANFDMWSISTTFIID